MTRDDKQRAIEILQQHFEEQADAVREIDSRLCGYFVDMYTIPDQHNTYEILCAVKFLRLLRTYEFNHKKVRQVVRLREGEWQADERGLWHYVRGGIKQPGTNGDVVYRFEPFQIFVLASVFGFQTWINTENEIGSRSMLPTERVTDDGYIEDLRRLCIDFTFYAPRKTDKTGLSAFIQVVFFLLEDQNSEAYCCANSSDQSKLLFRRTTQMLRQLDEGKGRMRLTQTVADWRPQYHAIRNSSIRPLSAGGKTKDGMYAQLCCADEYGSAPYTNGKSDMKMLVDVIQSSMGPRREPLTFTTTTAGRISTGPFIEKLDALHRLLEKEFDFEDGSDMPGLGSDRTLCLCFEPDDWEKSDEEYLLTSRDLRRKINPMLGKIVQHQFYEDGAQKAKMEGDLGEFVSKFLNVYQRATTKEWVSPEEIRALQIDKRIDDCPDREGWIVFCGQDFSKGDDLNGNAYLAYNIRTDEFFADMDVYMSEEAVNDSPIHELLHKWAKDGWLHIVPGKTFDPAWPVNRIIELDGKGVNFAAFGYDPYNAKLVVNAMNQWVFELGLNPKDIIQPVRQNFATYNPAVSEFDYMVKRSRMAPDGNQIPDPMIHFSRNPLWPYCFGCCVLQESTDGMNNFKPVKKDGAASTKVDPVQMLLSGLILYDAAEGQIQK